MKKTIGQRLKEVIDYKGLSPYKLHVGTKISQSTIGRIIKDEGTPNKSTLLTIADFLNVNLEWLLNGVGEMEAISSDLVVNVDTASPFEVIYLENNNSNSFIQLENGQYLMTMPLAEFNIQAGLLDHYQDIEYLNDLAKHSIIVDKPVKGRYIAFRVKGDSMDDGTSNSIIQGSIVSTRELQKQHWQSTIRFKDFSFWVIYTTQSRFPLLKEIIAHDTKNGLIRCHSLNDAPEYTDFDLSLNDVQALFYVVDVYKQLGKKLTY